MPYCRECGKAISETDKFCYTCGSPQEPSDARSERVILPTQSPQSVVVESSEAGWVIVAILIILICAAAILFILG